ncbi:MAG: ABC transporter substrate-binding protein [Clostridia bacterium]|nr:ABC transporter substrate-binding protein [Clostridia bacterium]
MKKIVLTMLLVLLMIMPTLAACQEKTTETQKGEPVELIWIMGNPGKVPPDQAIVEEELNKISVEKLNVKMKTLYYDNEKTMLALSTGEKFDMCFTCEWFNNYAVQAQAGYFADITEKVKTVTPELYATMPEIVWEGAKVNGKIYAIPVKKDYAAEVFWRFDKVLFVDTLGMEVKDKMDFFEIEPYLEAAKKAWKDGVKEAENAEFPLKLTKGGLGGLDCNFDMINRDAMLGIPYSAVGTPDEDKVVITVETPDLYDRMVALHKWFEAGYINKDAATVDDVGTYSAVKIGQGFYGADAIWTGADGYVQVISKFSGPYLSTASIRGAMNAISANTDHVDLSLKYQELVNTDQTYRDILRYGIEGKHWNKNEEGLAVRTALGRDNYNPWPFSQGSYSLSTVEAAEGVKVDPNMWKVIFDGYKDAVATKSIGFSFDITPVETQIAACKVVKDKYWVGLATGTLDPATEVPKMITELEAAGIRDIQNECQKQFDEFLKSKK